MAGVRSISGNIGLVRALHFPRASLPVSFSLQQLQQLLYSMIVLFAVAVGFGSYPSLSWLLILPALALQFLFNTGLALVMARLGSKTPDLAQLMPFVMRTWMYASGVMFSIPVMLKDKPAWIADVLQYNPAAVYMDLIRFALIFARMGSKTPDLAQLMPFVLRTWMYGSGVMFSIPVMLEGKPAWIADVLQYNPAAIYMDLVRFALIDGYGSENLPQHVWAVGLAWALVVGVVGFVYFWKAEERYGRG